MVHCEAVAMVEAAVEWQLTADHAAAAAAAVRDAREVSAVPLQGQPDPVAVKRQARLAAANERALGSLATYLDRFWAAAERAREGWAAECEQLAQDAAQPGTWSLASRPLLFECRRVETRAL